MLYVMKLSLYFLLAANGHQSTEGDDFELSLRMVTEGHAYYRSLQCPDGSDVISGGVGTTTDKDGKMVDIFSISCADGTKGSYRWTENSTSDQKPPPGFKKKKKK